MDRDSGPAFILLALLAGCLIVSSPLSAQLVLGQYEDEAPLGTWNVLGSPSAATAGLGVLFVRPFDASVSLAAPALLTSLPRTSVSLSGSYALSQMRKFSLVNTGVVTSNGNLTVGVLGVDHGAFAFRRGGWAFAVVVAGSEAYARPTVVAGSSAIGATYELRYAQAGLLRTFHGGVARRLAAGLSIGLGVNIVAGSLDRSVVERTETPERVVTITDEKSERFRGLFFNGGIAWEVSPGLTASAVFRTPYVKKGEGQSHVRYEVPEAGTDIRIDAASVNAYRQPWVIGAGCSWKAGERWTVAAEAAWFGWSAYEIEYYDEPLPRSFRDVVRAGAGVEYLARSEVFGRPAGIPFCLGFAIDPQPTSPPSTYAAVTLGTGLRYSSLSIDISGSLGREHGSGDGLKAGKIVLTLRYIFGPGRP